MVRDGHTAPVGVVGPSRQIAEDLRLAAALLTPKEHTSVVAFPSVVGDASNVLWAPVVVTELVEALEVHFVIDGVSALEVGERLTEVGLRELECDDGEDLADLGKCTRLSIGKCALELSYELLDESRTGLGVTQVRPDGLLLELLDEHVHDAIEDARWHEEFSKLVSAVTLFIDML